VSASVPVWTDAYAAALCAYLERPAEDALGRAHELGREALDQQVGVLEIVAEHGRALETHGGGPPTDDERRLAASFLLECLAPLEMARRGLHETVDELRSLHAELQVHHETLQQIFTSLPAMVLTVDRDLRYTLCDGAALEHRGLKPGELVGLTVYEYFGTEDAEFAPIKHYLQALHGEASTYDIDTHGRSYTVSVRPIADAEGEVTVALAVAVDVTELRAAREARALLASIVDSSQEPIIGKKLDGVITSWNAGAERTYGYSAGEVIGRPVTLIFPAELVAEEATLLERLRAGETIEAYETVRITKDGRRLSMAVTLSPIREESGTVVGASAVHHDLTTRIEAETALRISEASYRQLSASLERRVAERTAELDAANAELEAFASSVSHDLRAPLRSVDGFSHLLLERYRDQLDDEGRDWLIRIRGGVVRMGVLIDDLLRLSRAARVELRRQPLDLSAMVREIAAELRARHPNRDVEVVVADGAAADGDRGLVRTALENLLGNAWKFTSARPDARIEFGVEERDGERTFFVRDNGVGFDMAYADQLFKPFQRLHRVDEFPGTGIGLATVDRIVSRHGGVIHARAAPGEGATFWFTLGPGGGDR
jgi:PAS domain S-box-containing protein